MSVDLDLTSGPTEAQTSNVRCKNLVDSSWVIDIATSGRGPS